MFEYVVFEKNGKKHFRDNKYLFFLNSVFNVNLIPYMAKKNSFYFIKNKTHFLILYFNLVEFLRKSISPVNYLN